MSTKRASLLKSVKDASNTCSNKSASPFRQILKIKKEKLIDHYGNMESSFKCYQSQGSIPFGGLEKPRNVSLQNPISRKVYENDIITELTLKFIVLFFYFRNVWATVVNGLQWWNLFPVCCVCF